RGRKYFNFTLVVFLDDSFYQGKSQSPSSSFGGDPRVKNSLEMFFGDSRTGIRYKDPYHISIGKDFNCDSTFPAHRIYSVFHQILNGPMVQGLVQKNGHIGYMGMEGKMDEFGTSCFKVVKGIFGFFHKV